MSETNGSKKKKSKDNYVKTFRKGAVGANVFRRVAPGGFEYLDFSLSRAWKSSGGKEGYSLQFFSRNREAIKTVVDRACDFIESEQVPVDVPVDEVVGDVAATEAP